MSAQTKDNNVVGDELATVLPNDRKSWWKKPHLLTLNFCIFSATLLSGSSGYDNSMMNGLQALHQWQNFMNHPTGAWLGFVNAVQALGAIFGYPLMALVANRWGRKRPVLIGWAILALGIGLQTGAVNPAMFCIARAMVGTASGFFGAVPILITEVAYPTHRGKVTSGFNTFYYVGSLIAAWATFGTRNYENSWAWRIPSLLQILLPLLSVPGFLICPQSPRWLISQGRTAEARAILVKYHAGGDENSALVTFEMVEIERAIELEKAHSKSVGYADMFKTKGNRHRLFLSVFLGVFAQWNGVGVVSYYLAAVLITVGITSVTQQTLISGFLQLWNLIIAVLAATSVDRLGRRMLLITSSIGMLFCYIIITGLSGSFASSKNASTGIAVIPMLFIFYGFYDIAFTPLLVSYPAEIWQYSLRSRGLAVTYGSTFLALFFNLFVNPIALQSIAWKYYLVYVVILIGIVAVTYTLFPETRGRSLEEIAIVFDGEDADIMNPHEIGLAVNEKMHPHDTHVEDISMEAKSEEGRVF